MVGMFPLAKETMPRRGTVNFVCIPFTDCPFKADDKRVNFSRVEVVGLVLDEVLSPKCWDFCNVHAPMTLAFDISS